MPRGCSQLRPPKPQRAQETVAQKLEMLARRREATPVAATEVVTAERQQG